MNKKFAQDVKIGLTKKNKSLPSKYFYDETGSSLFSKIMKLPEYYLTEAEFEIFKKQSENIIEKLGVEPNKFFELIELGAGDGYKTIELIKELEKNNFNYGYVPIDISQKALNQIKKNINKNFPLKDIKQKKGDYIHILDELKETESLKIILFLGSNIGNMDDTFANSFLLELSSTLSKGDKIILGVDLKKSKKVILPAYNDSQGITKAFNLNLLTRINRELNADFNIDLFEHLPKYDEVEGIAKSFIKSKTAQSVNIKSLNLEISFKKDELIQTEISRKYDNDIIKKICLKTNLKVIGKFTDSRNYFADYIFEKN